MSQKSSVTHSFIIFFLVCLKVYLILNNSNNYLFYLDVFSTSVLVILYVLFNQVELRRNELKMERVFYIYHLVMISVLLPGYVGKEFIPIPYLAEIALAGSALLLIICLLVIKTRRVYLINLGLFLFLNVNLLISLIPG